MTTADLPCHGCGYDLRAHPEDGACPECGASVEEARRIAAIPIRPAWRDSDPRWRRRVLAGAWVLLLLPLLHAVMALDWASHVPVPSLVDLRGASRTLDVTLFAYAPVHQPLVFCVGIVLLFARERGRQRARLDWTRRWGVLCSYVVLLLCAAGFLFIAALVGTGISALFQTLPPKHQPEWTGLLVDVSSGYLRYGPQLSNMAAGVLVAFSSVAVLLACFPLYDALRSSGPPRVAKVLLAPMAGFALIHLWQAGRYCLSQLGAVTPPGTDVHRYYVYFAPDELVTEIASVAAGTGRTGSPLDSLVMEAVKWCVVLAIAVWLSVAQLATWRRGTAAKHAARADALSRTQPA